MFARTSFLAAVALALTASVASADGPTRTKPMVFTAMPKMVVAKPVFLCPEGWVVAVNPVNAQLRCLPNTLTSN